MSHGGIFIALEGGECVGKSTQLQALAEKLRAAGKSVVTTREPGGTEGAEAIRDLILNGEEDRWTAQTEALLFAAARADHVNKLIRPSLARGNWVLCDRFLESSRAYQGYASYVGDNSVRALHEMGSGGLLPDRVLLLDLGEADLVERFSERGEEGEDRIELRESAFHRVVRNAFRSFAEEEPERIRLINASGTQEEVTEKLWKEIEDLI